MSATRRRRLLAIAAVALLPAARRGARAAAVELHDHVIDRSLEDIASELAIEQHARAPASVPGESSPRG